MDNLALLLPVRTKLGISQLHMDTISSILQLLKKHDLASFACTSIKYIAIVAHYCQIMKINTFLISLSSCRSLYAIDPPRLYLHNVYVFTKCTTETISMENKSFPIKMYGKRGFTKSNSSYIDITFYSPDQMLWRWKLGEIDSDGHNIECVKSEGSHSSFFKKYLSVPIQISTNNILLIKPVWSYIFGYYPHVDFEANRKINPIFIDNNCGISFKKKKQSKIVEQYGIKINQYQKLYGTTYNFLNSKFHIVCSVGLLVLQ